MLTFKVYLHLEANSSADSGHTSGNPDRLWLIVLADRNGERNSAFTYSITTSAPEQDPAFGHARVSALIIVESNLWVSSVLLTSMFPIAHPGY
jgi:hypothetical protein